MATNVARVKAIADAITNSNTSNQLLSDFADDCILQRPDLYRPADPNNPTAEERSAVMVQMFRQYAQNIRRAAEQSRQDASKAAAIQAKADEL